MKPDRGNHTTRREVHFTWMHLSSASGASMRRRRRYPVVNVWVVLLVLGFAAAPMVTLGAPSLSVNPKVARVGDPVTITITVPGARASEIEWPKAEGGSVGELTLLKADTVTRGKRLSRLGGPSLVLLAAAYDTGSFSTGDFSMSVGGLPFTLKAQTVTIASVLDDSTGLHLRPLKAQEDLPITFNDLVRWFGPWIALAGILLILWELGRRWLSNRRRRAFEKEQDIPLLSPYEEAMLALAELEKNNPLASGDQKGYVTALGQISKRLLERTHRTPVMEMTTYEVRRWLTDGPTLCDPNDLLRILEAGDHVKFAKGSLTADDAPKLLESTKRIVAAYEPRVLPETNTDGDGSGTTGSEEPAEAAAAEKTKDSETADAKNESSGNSAQGGWRMHPAGTGANRGRKAK